MDQVLSIRRLEITFSRGGHLLLTNSNDVAIIQLAPTQNMTAFVKTATLAYPTNSPSTRKTTCSPYPPLSHPHSHANPVSLSFASRVSMAMPKWPLHSMSPAFLPLTCI